MNSLLILVGPETDHNPHFMDLASAAAELAVESGHRILFAGTSQTVLAVGTALVGKQHGRTVEGGERRPSPMVLLGLVRSSMEVPDPLCSDPDRKNDDFDGEHPHHEGGLLADLIDFGIMDLDDGMEGRIIARNMEELVPRLHQLLEQDRHAQALVIGYIPEKMNEILSYRIKKLGMRLGVVGGHVPKSGEAIETEVGELLLDGVPIMSAEYRRREEKYQQETDSNSLFVAAKKAVWEAGMSHAVATWVRGKNRNF